MKMNTTIEVAAAARISHATLHHRIGGGAGPRTILIGRRVLCSQAALEEWLQVRSRARNPGNGMVRCQAQLERLEERQMSDHKETPATLGIMWSKTTPMGETYFTGRLGGAHVICHAARLANVLDNGQAYVLQVAETDATPDVGDLS